MQAMDKKPEPAMPTDVSITSDTTRVDVVLRPPGVCGPRVELALRLAMMEFHNWVGIGGRTERERRPRRLSRSLRLALDNDYLRSGYGDKCRRRIGQAIKRSLREEEEYRYLTPADWDQAVPVGVERAIAVAIAAEAQRRRRGSGTFVASVDIRVQFEFVYSEPEALLLACDERDGEAPSSCSICFEEMSREEEEVTDMPGCTHGFHRGCIAPWFRKAATCPVCRRDQLHYLRPDYWDLHGRMAVDSDSLRDYL